MKRRIISAILLVVMLISFVPAQAFAEETTADISSTEMTVGGDSSFGGLLGNTVSEEQKKQSGSGEFECRITELTVEGTTAVVEYSVNTPATVVVAIYSDDGFTMLGSGTASVAVDNTWVAVDIEISKMPKFFTAGAFMLAPETNNPLSEEYKTTRYTKAYMDIKAATVADFDPELVLNLDEDMTTNFAVFNENTILFDYTSDAVLTDYHNGTYLIKNAGEDLLAMQPGDKFAYTYADGTVLIVCAADVKRDDEKNPTSVFVSEQTDADLSDVFDFVKIEADSFDKEVTYDDSTLSEGVEMIDPAEVDQLYEASLMGLGDIPIVDKKLKASKELGVKLNKKFNDNVTLSGAVKYAFTTTLEVFISLNYQNVSYSIENEVSVKISLTGKAEREIPFPGVDIYFLPGVYGHVEPKFVFEVSGAVDWTGKFKSTTKYVYDSDIGLFDASSGPSLKSEVSVSGKILTGLKVDVGITVISKKILKGGMEAKACGELSMKNKIDDLSTPDTKRIHECLQCYEGELNKVVSLSVYLDILDGKIKPELVVAEAKSKISDCYKSIDYNEFKFTRCPHISHKVSVQLLKGENPVQTCVPIELYEGTRKIDSVYVLDENNKPKLSSVPASGEDGTSTFYLPNGKYKVIVELDGERQEKEFTIRNGEKQLKLAFEEKGSDYPLTISQTTVKMDKGSTQQLNAYFNGKDVTRSCTWQSSDSTAASVSKGKVTAKKAGSAAISASYSSGGKTYSVSCTVTIAAAAAGIASGKCGENLTWTLDDAGTLTISGTGEMYGYMSDSYPWYEHREKIKTIVIESGVTSIGNHAFFYCTALTTVTIPASITGIDGSSFGYCTSLTSINVNSENRYYSSVNGVLFNKAATELVCFPCGRQGGYTIPVSVTSIGNYAFYWCINLTSVTIPNSVTSIESAAFWGCHALTSVTIPDSMTNIDNFAFSHCNALTSINVASGNSYYASVNGVLFNKILTELVSFPGGRTGAYTIPSGVMSIGVGAFDLSLSLTSVTIPDSVTSIEYAAFCGCTALKSVTIGSGVKEIGSDAFLDCTALTDVYYTGTEAQWDAISIGKYNDNLTSATIHFNSDVTALSIDDDEEELEDEEGADIPDEEPKEDAAEPEEPTEEEEEPLPEIEIEPETEPEPEPEPEEEESPDALIVDVPDAAPAAELELAAAHKGTSGTKGKFRTAKFTNLEPGEEYVLIVSVDPAALLKPTNLLYIAQDNAAADGTLTLSYIPRTETPSAAVTLYGVPHERYITLDREYMAMQIGESAVLSAEVTPAEWAEYLTWSAENPDGKEIISVSDSGSVTALGVGTAYAVATVSYKDYTFTARCRVDVTEKSVEEEIEISGIELGTTAVTSELYSRDYAEADILLLLPQNISVMSADAAEKPEDNGIAIKSARFMDPAAAEKFDLAVVDDRRVAVVPKDGSIENAKAVKSSYTSAVAVTVGNTEFVTDAKLKLTVKKTLPKLKADAVQFNSFYSGQSAPIVINGASVTAIRPDTGKKLAVPAWLTLSDDGKLSIAPDAPGKSASGSAYILVDTEEWEVPAAVTVSVKNTYKAPKLKLSAASVTMSSVSSRGVEMKLMPTAKNETLEQYNVTGLTAYDGYTVENFDAEMGAFTLKTAEGSKAGRITLYASFADTETTVPIALTVRKTAPVIKLKTASVTLNPAYGDMAIIDVTITPADYDDRTVSVSNAEGELEVWYKDGKLYVHTLPITKYSSTYKVTVSIPGGKAAVLTVRTAKENLKPSVTLRASGAIDLTYSDSAVTLTPAFRNFNGGYTVTGGTVAETKGKTEISGGDISSYFSMEQNGNTLTLKKAEGTELTAGNTYTAKLIMLLGREELTATAKITVKATPVNLRLSKSALTLNKLVNDSAAIGVTCTTKNYTPGEPVISVMDKTGKQSAEGKLDVSYSGGMLYVAVNDATEYGAVYKVLINAGEGYKAAVLNVTVPAQAKSAITGTLKAKGSIDIIRSGSGITLVPTYKNVSSAEYTERVEVYSSADKFAKPVEGVFAIDGMKLTNICADSRLKYKVRVIAGFANGTEAATPLTAITVKTGAARLTVSGTPVLYLKDVNSRGDFRVTSADLTLNGIAKAEIKDAKNAAMFELYEYGGGRFAIGFKDGVIAPAAAKLKSVSIPINIWLDGSETAKPNAAVTIKINIAK